MRVALLALSTALLLPSPAMASGDEVVRTLNESFDAATLASLYVDFPVGELAITGADGNAVEVEIRLECDEDGWGASSCRERADELALDGDTRGDRLNLAIDGYRRWRSSGLAIHMTVRVPAHLGLIVDMSIGELTIADMRNDVTVDMSIGEVDVRLAAEDVAEVVMDTGIGETSLRAPDARRGAAGLFVSETSWKDGSGEARVRVDLGIGEIDVRLR